MAKPVRSTALLLLFFLLLGPAAAQSKLDKNAQSAVVGKLAEFMDAQYVFPDKGKAVAEAILERRKRGEYDQPMDRAEFAALLTTHLREVTNDKHLRVRCSGAPQPPQSNPGARVAEGSSQPGSNILGRFERLPGNIGYYEVNGFRAATPEVTAAIAQAMDQLADSDALIIDLRKNGGGNPETVALLSSYLFDKPTHLNSLYWREGNRTVEFWTKAEVSGKKYGQRKDVYVLTALRTFSAAEEFTYNLKSLGRAVIVGATTGGGAHPGNIFRLHDDCTAFISTGRAINPITKSNWEGTGVVPDVAVEASKALEHAQVLILNKKLAATTDEQQRALLNSRLAELTRGR